MKPFVTIAAVAAAGCTFCSMATEHEPLSNPDSPQQCYALAMIGMDFVINSRLGVLPEQAVELARITTPLNDNTYDNTLLNIMLEAYLWPDSPHSYAETVLDHCMKTHS